MAKLSSISMTSILTVLIAVLIPILSIGYAAYYFGFIFQSVEKYNDPCVRLYTEKTCNHNKKCKYNKKRKICTLDSECMGAGQQNCGEGCHWDATVKKPGSNLYGMCRPATLAKVGEKGTQEVL